MKVFLEFASTQQLWKAIDSRDEGTVRTLLERGADPDLKNLAGRSALHLAAIAGSEPITQLLLDESRKINVNAKDKDGNTALRWAVLRGYGGIVGLLLGRGANTTGIQDKDTRDGAMAESVNNLLKKPALLKGPALGHKTLSLYKSEELLPDACWKACQQIYVTKTSFYMIKEQNKTTDGNDQKSAYQSAISNSVQNKRTDKNIGQTPDIDETKENDSVTNKKEDKKAGKDSNEHVDSDTVEWRLSQTSTVYETLYSREREELPAYVIGQYLKPPPSKTWTWYHFPANNVCSSLPVTIRKWH